MERVKGHNWTVRAGEPIPYEQQTPREIDVIFRRLYQFSIVNTLPPASPIYQTARAELEFDGAFQPTVSLIDFPIVPDVIPMMLVDLSHLK